MARVCTFITRLDESLSIYKVPETVLGSRRRNRDEHQQTQTLIEIIVLLQRWQIKKKKNTGNWQASEKPHNAFGLFNFFT